MIDLFDTTGIPDDAAHWDALASQVTASAVRRSRESGFEWFAQSRAGLVAASILLAISLASMLPPAPVSSRGADELAQAVTPTDDLGGALLASDGPPAIGSLLFSGLPGERR